MLKAFELIRLEPGQVGDYWELVKLGLTGGLAGADRSQVRDQNILEQLIAGSMQCWLLVSSEGVEAMATSQIYEDAITLEKIFYIYSLWSYNETGTVPMDEWVKAFNGLRDYADKQGCTKIVSYTNEDRVKAIYEAAGGVERFSFMVAKVKGAKQNAISNGKLDVQSEKA